MIDNDRPLYSCDSSVTHPLITIAITCHNARDTIRRAVVSAAQQTWPNREILILDDHSTDGSWDVIQSLIHKFPELRAIRHGHNRGVAAARNSLLAKARGEFIAFFDDDDESATDRLKAQYERMNAYGMAHGTSFIFCYSNGEIICADDTKPSTRISGIGRHPPEPNGIIAADYFLGVFTSDAYCWGRSETAMLIARTAAFRIAGGFDERFRRGEDVDLYIRAALKGAHFISVDAPLLRKYETETPDKADTIDLQYRLFKLRKYKAYLKSKKAYLGAVANMHANFYHGIGCHRQAYVWRALALVLFPWRIASERLKERWHSVTVRDGGHGCC